MPIGELVLARPVHPAGRLVEADEARRAAPAPPRPAITIASASRWRSPPERSRGSAVGGPFEADGRERSAAGLAGELVARPARGPGSRRGSGRAARIRGARRSDPRTGSTRPGDGAQQGALAGAVSAHQRDPLAAARRQVDPAQHVARPVAGIELDPQIPRLKRAGDALGMRRRRANRRIGARRVLLAARSALGQRFSAPPCTPTGQRAQPGERRTAARPGVASAGSAGSAHSRKLRRGPVEGDRARPASRRRGRPRQAALEPVLAEQRRPSPTPR